jgi:hypothetical protein
MVEIPINTHVALPPVAQRLLRASQGRGGENTGFYLLFYFAERMEESAVKGFFDIPVFTCFLFRRAPGPERKTFFKYLFFI